MFNFAALITFECGEQRVYFVLANLLGKMKMHEKQTPLHLNGRDIHRALLPEPAASLRAKGANHPLRGQGVADETILRFLELCWEQGPGVQ